MGGKVRLLTFVLMVQSKQILFCANVGSPMTCQQFSRFSRKQSCALRFAGAAGELSLATSRRLVLRLVGSNFGQDFDVVAFVSGGQ